MKYYNSQKVCENEWDFEPLFNCEMQDIFSGKAFFRDVPYFPIMSMDGSDGIAQTYGEAGALIAGLLFGYSVESTIALIRFNPVFRRY